MKVSVSTTTKRTIDYQSFASTVSIDEIDVELDGLSNGERVKKIRAVIKRAQKIARELSDAEANESVAKYRERA